jgi:hypothetical protein
MPVAYTPTVRPSVKADGVRADALDKALNASYWLRLPPCGLVVTDRDLATRLFTRQESWCRFACGSPCGAGQIPD